MKYIISIILTLFFTLLSFNEGFSITSSNLHASEDVRNVKPSDDAGVQLTMNGSENSALHEKGSKRQARLEKRLYKKFAKKLSGPERPRKPAIYEPMAIASLVTGVGGVLIIIVSLLSFFFLSGALFILGLVFCLLGVVFGGIALKKFKNGLNNGKGRGLALAGLITGIVPVVLFLALIVAFILTF